ncbi:GmrSD restriction endonuclease domain-containing protein [Clostridium intestinale]|uniref:GmrSD restriction endonuclease domain-containing protein n=1 Tax=Clostridium intestinale TaxID=36845 RepID=UPI002DD6609C|nr:DUF262 domain-containing protein [Clostridium intestinale]WRY49994.1 DUF262 domain-containing protein [Clostridium intestinale]
MNTLTNFDTESIIGIIDMIDSRNIALPEFQRDFVWDISRTYDLFDSFVKNVFVGSIIYGIPSFSLTVREIDDRPRSGIGSRRKLKNVFLSQNEIKTKVQVNNFKLVLDGQQRITSIYRALKGIDDVWIIMKNNDELDESLQDIAFKSIPLESSVFSIEGYEDMEHLSINLSTVYKKINDSLLQDDIEEYFKQLNISKNLDNDSYKNLFKTYLQSIQKIEDLFKSQKLVAYFLLDMSADKFALFFERSNSLGISLTFVDILVAKLINGFNLRKKIEEFETQNPNFELNRELVARTVAFLVGKKVDKKYILSQLKSEHFNTYWDEITNLYKSSIEYLYNNNFILNYKWIPYPNTIIPIMMFLRNLPNKSFSQMNQNQKNFLEYWYWSSVLSQRYVAATNEIIILDSSVLSDIAKGNKITDKLYMRKLKTIISNYEDIISYNKKGSAIYVALLNFINYNASGLLDWNNCSNISFTDKIDDHHIFPREYLNSTLDEESDRNLINSIANRTLIPKITNIKIGKKAPHIYMEELLNINPDFKRVLENHMIPSDILSGLYENFYDTFIEERAKLIFNKIYEKIISKKESLERLFVTDVKKSSSYSGTIPIWGLYKKKRAEAVYNIDTQEVLYNGNKYSISTSADKAKIDLGAPDSVSTNGWKWWKYTDSSGETQGIEDYRY